MSHDELFLRYLTTLQQVLNGEAFLFRFRFDFELEPRAVFEHLLRDGVLTEQLRAYYQEVEASGDLEALYLYRAEELPYRAEACRSLPDATLRSSELSAEQFHGVLASTLDCRNRGFGRFSSFYGHQLAPAAAAELATKIQDALSSPSEPWRFFWFETEAFDPITGSEDFYFSNLGNDSCVVGSDGRSELFVLFTNGTD